ncbi:MAG: P-loop NTPase fold protein [Thermodesulfobacteriota bacterium]|nr:P-loop NTPase fold protein [Thermodesulfobacteriota bacterium]
MSLALIKRQIAQFLQTDTLEVMAIRGAWGVGKTFAWNKYLNEAKHNNRIALDNYSYVSLFGLNSMDELKLSIFMDAIHKKNIDVRCF